MYFETVDLIYLKGGGAGPLFCTVARMLNMYFYAILAHWICWVYSVFKIDTIPCKMSGCGWLKWVRKWISCAAFLCLCASSPSGQGDSGAVCVGDGVASEHRPGQELHLALLGERPAAGDVSHRRLGFRTTVSFNAPPPPGLFVVLICRLLGP